MSFVAAIVIAYLLGSVSTSMIIARLVAKTDIRNHGSGNAGATNTVRLLGMKWGIVVLILDTLKGILAVLIAHVFAADSLWAMYICAIAVVVGHNWPVYFSFRGGKGIATTIGVLFLLVPGPAGLAAGVAAVSLLATRFVSLGSLCFTILTPVFCSLLGRPMASIIFTSVIAVLSVYRHRQNIMRLFQGKENRIFSKS